MRNNYQSKLDAKVGVKRYLISLLVSLPILILVGFLMRNANRAVRILVFVAILCVTFFVCEFIFKKKDEKREEKKKNKEDVFK